MTIDLNKSLAELTGVDWGPPPEGVGALIQERHLWHRLPLAELPDRGLVRFIECGIDSALTVPVAVSRLEDNFERFGMLITVLNDLDFPWLENPDLVRRLRVVATNALDQLRQWDATAEVHREALVWRSLIAELWAHFEVNLNLKSAAHSPAD